jgi:tRNA(fMet)-specific endonuclease VapC
VKLLLDTSAYSAFFRGDPRIVPLVQSAREILLPSIVLGELFAGFALGNREEKNLAELEQFLSSPRVRVVYVMEESARWYSQIYQELRAAGTPVPTNDLWIAAVTREHGAALASLDAHFAHIAGLRLLPRQGERRSRE